MSHITAPAPKGPVKTVKAAASGYGQLAIHDRYAFQNIGTIWTKPTRCLMRTNVKFRVCARGQIL